jgi:hypothetical protein
MPLRDATPAALALQAAIHRRQTPAERFRTAVDMSDFAHNLALAGVKRRNPGYTERETTQSLVESLYASPKPRLQ